MVADLAERGVDLSDRELRRTRTWHWLAGQIEALLAVPPQLVVDTWQDANGAHRRVLAVPQTRLGLSLDPPDLLTAPATTTQPEED